MSRGVAILSPGDFINSIINVRVMGITFRFTRTPSAVWKRWKWFTGANSLDNYISPDDDVSRCVLFYLSRDEVATKLERDSIGLVMS